MSIRVQKSARFGVVDWQAQSFAVNFIESLKVDPIIFDLSLILASVSLRN
ncbi:hypothetical protein PL8927_730039 [Planktothrix serta PCC 8927]|uniref:Uncharacterized protein n=1 Tax=Planktothrix serta PCC 8927 TaxID=671068 RepID=A0A7Z9BZA0_9CYAN|nr:hypothetical protein PL8927_730039 [Planktothrix serta PCC 8927]